MPWLGIDSVQSALGHVGGAAQDVQLLQHDHIRAVLVRGDRGSQARAAAAHDHHVAGVLGVLGRGLLGLGLERLQIQPGIGQGGFRAAQDCARGDGRAGDDVHSQALLVHDALGHAVDGDLAHADGLVLVGHLNLRDLVAVHGDGHGDRSVMAGSGGFVNLLFSHRQAQTANGQHQRQSD